MSCTSIKDSKKIKGGEKPWNTCLNIRNYTKKCRIVGETVEIAAKEPVTETVVDLALGIVGKKVQHNNLKGVGFWWSIYWNYKIAKKT
ncbi:hypothetical protein FACS189481_4050 [Clostridia bacterium]|nr:hypothetical protein FACS189481_4050 [Clostridia bacterium]